MIYRFVLDNTVVEYQTEENPVGWDEMLINVNRDRDLKGLFVNLDATLTFTQDGYDYLKSIYNDSDYCEEVKISVQRSIDDGQNYIERYKGLLFQSDWTFDDFACSVEVKFTDDSFYGRIDHRRSTQAYLTGDKTINGIALSPAPVYNMQLFDPATGLDLPLLQPYGIYRIYDVLQYLVAFMTDGKVEFDSPVFGTGGDFGYLGLTYGFAIRQTGNNVTLTLRDFTDHMQPITFETLFKELDHRFNLGMYIDETGSKPKLIIDYWKELFQQGTMTTFPDLPNLKTKIAKEFIYSKVKFAGADIVDQPASSFPGGIRFIGFRKEEYLVTGKCNVDTTLDLSYDFINDTNAIEEISVLSGIDDSFDEDWFLIDCLVAPGQLTAKRSNWITPGATEQFYNESLTNYEISKRFFGFIPNSIAAYLGSVDNSFRAEKTTFQYPVFGGDVFTGRTKIIFQDDSALPNKDPGGNFDPVTSEYTAPNSGIYSFDIFIREFYIPFGNIAYPTLYYLERYDSGGTFISEILLGQLSTQYGYVTGNFSASMQMAATDYAIVTFIEGAGFNSATVEAQSVFSGIATVDGGGVYQTYEPADYPIHISEFTTEIFDSQTDAILSGKLSKIAYYIQQSDPRVGWIDSLIIDEFKGTIQAKILRSRTEEPKLIPPDIRYVQIISTLPDTPFTITPDFYGRPSGGAGESSRSFFFKGGDEITVAIPAVHMGCNMLYINVQEIKADGSQPPPIQYPSGVATFTVVYGSNYFIQLSYDLSTPGNTFPTVLPIVGAPTVLGANGSVTIFCFNPNNVADFTFSWDTGDTTNVISQPAGTYTCTVTNTIPGTFDTNVLVFTVEIPVSATGQ